MSCQRVQPATSGACVLCDKSISPELNRLHAFGAQLSTPYSPHATRQCIACRIAACAARLPHRAVRAYCGKQVGVRADEHVVIEVKDPVVSAQVVLDQRKLEKSQRMFQPCAVRAGSRAPNCQPRVGADTTSIRLKERARELCEWAGASSTTTARLPQQRQRACDRLHGHVPIGCTAMSGTSTSTVYHGTLV